MFFSRSFKGIFYVRNLYSFYFINSWKTAFWYLGIHGTGCRVFVTSWLARLCTTVTVFLFFSFLFGKVSMRECRVVWSHVRCREFKIFKWPETLVVLCRQQTTDQMSGRSLFKKPNHGPRQYKSRHSLSRGKILK